MSVSAADPRVIQDLQARITAVQGADHQPVPTHRDLAGLVQLRAGASYAVDSASLALALLAGVSAAGEWTAAVGWPDFGVEAAVSLGADLSRTVIVPDPGPQWLEATSALVDVMRLVVLRPAGPVDTRTTSTLSARLRKRSATLVIWGDWPRCEARLGTEQVRWSGAQRGPGRLTGRIARISVRRGAAPPVRDEWVVGAPHPDPFVQGEGITPDPAPGIPVGRPA